MTTGHLFIPPFYVDANSATSEWYVMLAAVDGSARGAIVSLKKAGLNSVRCIYSAWAVGTLNHRMRPGWWAPWTPDSSTGVTTQVNGVAQAVKFSTGSASWVIPSGVPEAMDRIVLYLDGGDPVKIERIRSGVTTTICASVTAGSSFKKSAVAVLTSTVTAGDTITLTRASGIANCLVAAMAAYVSTGVPDPTMHYVPEDWWLDNVTMPGSGSENDECWVTSTSSECAYEVAPTGSALKFVGGTAHNDGTTFCAEVSVTEVWTKGGSTWTPVPGYWIDTHVFTRSSSVRYTDGTTILGTLTYTYTLQNYLLQVTTLFTASTTLDTGHRYFAMLPMTSCSYGHNDAGENYKTDANYTGLATARMAWYETNVADSGWFMHVEPSGGAALALVNFNTNRKTYFGLSPDAATGVASGTAFGGTWQFFVGPNATTISQSVASIYDATGNRIIVPPENSSPSYSLLLLNVG